MESTHVDSQRTNEESARQYERAYLFDEIDSEDEDESSDDANREETDDSWTRNENSNTAESE
jgi:hypothetical protein